MDLSLTTIWRVDAPIERVYDAIYDSLAWPRWWDAVLKVEDVAPGDAEGIGAVRAYVFKGRLPYTLGFETRLDRAERPTVLAGTATGELAGTGVWTLSGGRDGTIARYDWNIRTTPAWMNAVGMLPFTRQIFELNHDFVMDRGRVGLGRLLGVRTVLLRRAAGHSAEGAAQPRPST
jgi:hypothetical protein